MGEVFYMRLEWLLGFLKYSEFKNTFQPQSKDRRVYNIVNELPQGQLTVSSVRDGAVALAASSDQCPQL